MYLKCQKGVKISRNIVRNEFPDDEELMEEEHRLGNYEVFISIVVVAFFISIAIATSERD